MVGCSLVFDYKEGDRVRTPEYGEGVIIEVDESDTEYPYLIEYEGGLTFWGDSGNAVKIEEVQAAPAKPFARFDDEYVDDEDVFNALVSMGVTVTQEQYTAALEIGTILYKVRNEKEDY